MAWPDLSGVLTGLPWAVVGAVAARQYMPERMTHDLDVAVLSRDRESVRARLRNADFTQTGELSVGGSQWRAPDGTPLDVLETEGSFWETALHEASDNLDAQGLPALPLPYLVLSKLQAGRAQDVADVSRMLGAASEGDLGSVRLAVRTYAPDLLEDIESLIALGRLEMEGG